MKTVQPIRDPKMIQAMKDNLAPRDRFLFTLGINVGLRISDLLQLKVKDVKDKRYLNVYEEKTNKQKRFLLNKELRAIIDEYTKHMEPEDWLFPSRKGDKPISRVQAYRVLNDTAKKIGLEEIGTHTLRKTFGYHFFKKYKDIVMLQDIFNHSAPSVTLAYIGITQDEQDKLIENFHL